VGKHVLWAFILIFLSKTKDWELHNSKHFLQGICSQFFANIIWTCYCRCQIFYLCRIFETEVGGSVSIVATLEFGWPEFDSHRGLRSLSSRLYQTDSEDYPTVKVAGYEAYHTPSSSSKVMIE